MRAFKGAKSFPSNHPVWILLAFQVIPDKPKKTLATWRVFLNVFFLPEYISDMQLHVITLLFAQEHNSSAAIPVTKQLYIAEKFSLINL